MIMNNEKLMLKDMDDLRSVNQLAQVLQRTTGSHTKVSAQ